MRILRSSDIPSYEITPESVYLRRREFIKGAAALVLFAVLPARAALPPYRKGAYGTGEEVNSWKDITTYNNFYEFGTDKSDPARYAHTLRTRPWTVGVDEECLKPKTWDMRR